MRANLRRRGVLLLVIMGLLAMFGLVALAFVMVAGQHGRSARNLQRIDQQMRTPQQDLHQALLQVVRGENNPMSAVAPHSLLEDMYGHTLGSDGNPRDSTNPRTNLKMTAVDLVAQGQLFEFQSPGNNPYVYLGCVLTILNGPAAGKSTHIVGVSQAYKLQATAFDGVLMSQFKNQVPYDYIINGAPFAGTGAGYESNKIGQNALRPNILKALGTDPTSGGMNEDYDAVDYNNMALATPPVEVPGMTPKQYRVIPSFYRPELIKYWESQGPLTPDVLRAISLRPIEADHPNFPKLNSLFTGPWDVDNDGDGIPDSIWIDLGMPVRSMPDGRLYKPMYAIHCVDLDGRLNVNAHGSWAQTTAQYYQGVDLRPPQPPNPLDPKKDEIPGGDKMYFASGQTTANLPRGQGWGVADVNLRPLFLADDQLARYRALLGGYPSLKLDGRYADFDYATDGRMPPPGPQDETANLLHQQLWFQYQGTPVTPNFWRFVNGIPVVDAYGSPPDLLAAGAVGLDVAGRPMWAWTTSTYPDVDPQQTGLAENRLNPYKVNLSRRAPRGATSPAKVRVPDNPYSPEELERLLRIFDRDNSSAAGRLLGVTAGPAPDENYVNWLRQARHKMTTDSWDVPVPSGVAPVSLRRATSSPHVTDLLTAKGVPPQYWRQLLPPELLRGERMNLNRPYGTGASFVNTGESTGPATGREVHARHLYVLAMLVSDMDHLTTVFGERKAACRYLAQWAVNVVDFMDRDPIMTRFAFDENPWDGWSPPAADESFVVWGCERPELLLTEALAFHDRRTADTKREQPTPKLTTDKEPDNDDDFDQVKKPLGSLFFEIFNPWSALDPPSAELHGTTSAGWEGAQGVLLTKKAPSGAPIWRVVIASPGEVDEEQPDIDDKLADDRPTVYASIYFTPPPSGFAPDGEEMRFFPDDGWKNKTAALQPGRYMVVGPNSPDEKFADDWTVPHPTWIGELNTMSDWTTDRSSIRRIVLDPDPNPEAPKDQVKVVGNGETWDSPTGIRKPVAAIINASEPVKRRMSLTWPKKAHYPEVDPADVGHREEVGGYPQPYDEPFDFSTVYHDQDMIDALMQNGTVSNFRVLHLQRLADPTQPYNSTTNPYRTIDSLPVDLTVFNGIKKPIDSDTGQEVPELAKNGAVTDGNTQFQPRQRGERNSHGTEPDYNIWKQEPLVKQVTNGSKTKTDHVFQYEFVHTLGYLNRGKDLPIFGEPAEDRGPSYIGDPKKPFPWLTWNNRPFANAMELMLVPTVQSSKLLGRGNENPDEHDPKYYGYVHSEENPNAYKGDPSETGADDQLFPHLLNFFQSDKPGSTGTSNSMQLHRLLDYVHVPSRFVGATLQGNQTTMVNGDHWFKPPFNHIPTYREPGRINLNTIYYPEVFYGMINEIPGTTSWRTFGERDAAEMWDRFVQSRRGDTIKDVLDPVSNMPTIMPRPFRSAASGDLVPLDTMKPEKEIDATILRSDPINATKPLFERRWSETEILTHDYDNTDRNPYFRYQALQKLSSVATTRSNVYAIWITVGYFEVDWKGVSATHPDGYALGQEVGSDTGEIDRHRAFYIFDRSIPVGFQRGMDVNVENAILVRRYIE
jgi:hypothetical protein